MFQWSTMHFVYLELKEEKNNEESVMHFLEQINQC